MPVQVQQEQLDHCRVALTIEVPPEEIQKATEAVFNQMARRTNVPGFRPGKAPRHLLKRFVSESQVKELAMDQALQNAFRDAVRQAGVSLYAHAEPKVDFPDEEPDVEKGFRFTATVSTQPHVHLGDLEGLSARRVRTLIAEADVDAELAKARERAATYEEVDEPAAMEDRVEATLQVTVNGEPKPEQSLDKPTLIQIGANVTSFDEGLIGMRAGEQKSFEFSYPGDEPGEEVRATADVSVSSVRRRTVPDLTEEWARASGAESLEALREVVREALQRQADAMADMEVEESLVRQLVARSTAHFPEEMLQREETERMGRLLAVLEEQSVSIENYLAGRKTDLARLQEEMRREAEAQISRRLVLGAFGLEEGLAVDDREVEDEIRRMAEAEDVRLSQMRRVLKDTGRIPQVRDRLYFRKIVARLKEKAEIQEV